jgi:hypothetical protein
LDPRGLVCSARRSDGGDIQKTGQLLPTMPGIYTKAHRP